MEYNKQVWLTMNKVAIFVNKKQEKMKDDVKVKSFPSTKKATYFIVFSWCFKNYIIPQRR